MTYASTRIVLPGDALFRAVTLIGRQDCTLGFISFRNGEPNQTLWLINLLASYILLEGRAKTPKYAIVH